VLGRIYRQIFGLDTIAALRRESRHLKSAIRFASAVIAAAIALALSWPPWRRRESNQKNGDFLTN
jgi:hypothetical protein